MMTITMLLMRMIDFANQGFMAGKKAAAVSFSDLFGVVPGGSD